MHKSLLKSLLFAVLAVVALTLTPLSFAQVVTSGMTGTVKTADGKPVSGAAVTAVHVPTNATFRATSTVEGRFNFRGLPVGGPYTLSASADGNTSQTLTDLTTELGTDITVNVVIRSDVVELEKFVVTSDRNALDGSAQGASTVLTSDRLAAKPTSERSLADLISATPLVTLRSTFGDREESQITAVGQNNRYNSIQIDGARINDQFGLNGTGLASFFNPLSVDTLEQLAVSISPYDVRQAGFTGASINAVTKSGTNKYKGSVYYFFTGDELAGIELRGENGRDRVVSNRKIVPKLDRRTYGVTFGGPIIQNKLFFFLSYEDFESISAGRDPRFSTAQESQILARFQQYSTASGKDIAWGNPVTGATSNKALDEKILAKVDWNITDNHRLSVRYSTTEGEVPQFGNFASSSSNLNGISGGITTSSDGHFYSQTRKEKAVAAQLFSQWTPDFKTEIKYSSTTQDQLTPTNSIAPAVHIVGVTGIDLSNGNTVTNGTYIAGVEQFRHGNVINVAAKQFSATGDYFWKDFVFTAGVEREQTDFFNLFRFGSYGTVVFRTLNDFLNDTNVSIQRNVFDPNIRNVADVSDFGTTGIFAQARWDISPRLNVVAGIRYEFLDSSVPPALNQTFLSVTGFRNDGTVDGASSISPRIGFNWALDDERKTQLRGGIGHFVGRAPWVFFSNSYGQTGVGSFTRFQNDAVNPLPSTFTSFLATQFDPANPIGTGTDTPGARREIDFTDDGIHMPEVWRANLALEHKLPFLNSTATVEAVHTIVDQALFIANENLRATTLGADGRQRFAGNPASGTGANARFAAFTDIFRTKNVGVGKSTYVTLSWDRPVKDKWGFNISYSRGQSTEAQAVGQTTASGQWQRNVVFNQGAVEEGTSDFEIKDRVQISLTREFEFYRNWRTRTSLYYEGRTGNPYSWVYGSDLNADGRNDNDTVAVPSGVGDARFDFSSLTATQTDTYLAFLNSSGLAKFAGGVAPKNSFTEPWVNRLDLKISQEIPIYSPAKLTLALDFINFGAFISQKTFGYTEIAPGISNDVFRRRFLSNAAYGTDGRIRPGAITGGGFIVDSGMSRWRIQLSAKLEF